MHLDRVINVGGLLFVISMPLQRAVDVEVHFLTMYTEIAFHCNYDNHVKYPVADLGRASFRLF